MSEKNQESSTSKRNETFELFKKYLNYIDAKESINPAEIKPLDPHDDYDLGENYIESIQFGWFKIDAVTVKLEMPFGGTKDGIEYQLYECISTEGSREEPPDYEENFVESFDSPVKCFMSVLVRLLSERLDNALMAEDFMNQGDEEEVILLPYVVNYTLDGIEGQFFCEAINADIALEICSDIHAGCEVTKVLIQGEE